MVTTATPSSTSTVTGGLVMRRDPARGRPRPRAGVGSATSLAEIASTSGPLGVIHRCSGPAGTCVREGVCSTFEHMLAARLPATARVLGAGEIGPGQVAVIRRTMGRLDKLEHVTVEQWRDAEQQLAQAATTLSPRGLDQVAKHLLAHLDPDGAAPDEREERFDGLRPAVRRDGSLWLRAVIRDAVDAELIREGFDAASTPAGPDDDRTLENRQAAALKEFVLHATA